MNLQEQIQAKYARWTTPEHLAAFQAVGIVRMILAEHREVFERLIDAKRHMDNVGGLLDPTLYRDMLASKSLARQLKISEAALVFLAAIDEVAEEAK